MPAKKECPPRKTPVIKTIFEGWIENLEVHFNDGIVDTIGMEDDAVIFIAYPTTSDPCEGVISIYSRGFPALLSKVYDINEIDRLENVDHEGIERHVIYRRSG